MTTEQTAMEKANQHLARRGGAKGASAAVTVRDMLERAAPQIKAALPKHMTPERMVRIAYSAIARSPSLLKCDAASIVRSVIEASELGLEPSGVLGHAYLVPFRNNKTGREEAQLHVGYRGFIELAHRSGRVRSICAEVVYQGDEFEFVRGTEEKLRHVPCLNRPDDATPICAYACVHYTDGGVDFEVLGLDKIAKAQKASRGSNSSSSPWVQYWEEMARKTAIRRLAKRLPLSPELMTAAVADEVRELPGAIDAPFVVTEEPEAEEPAKKVTIVGSDGKEIEPEPGREPGEEG